MRGSFVGSDQQAVWKDSPRFDEPLDQLDDGLILDCLTDHIHEDVLVQRVEKLGQVEVHGIRVSLVDVGFRTQDCILRAPVRSEPEAGLREQWLVYGRQDLRYRLLEQTIECRRYAQGSGPAVGFRNLHPPDGLGFVFPRPDLGLYLLDVGGQPLLQFEHRHSVNARSTFVADDLSEGLSDVLIVEDAPNQIVVSGLILVFRDMSALRFMMLFRFRRIPLMEAFQGFLLSLQTITFSDSRL